MSNLKPIHFYSHRGGPNPTKVLIFFHELGLPFESEYVSMEDIKKEPYTKVNPNGRLPSIYDPNTGVTLWESGAIIEYLLAEYDKGNKLSYTSSPEKYVQNSWKHFQMSGQGPYFGQYMVFKYFHPEKNITSAIDRYANEIKRVTGVIESHLSKTGNEYLVGDKVCFADLMFVPWDRLALGDGMGPDGGLGDKFRETEWQQNYPKAYAWHQKLLKRDSVKKTVDIMNKARAEEGH